MTSLRTTISSSRVQGTDVYSLAVAYTTTTVPPGASEVAGLQSTGQSAP